MGLVDDDERACGVGAAMRRKGAVSDNPEYALLPPAAASPSSRPEWHCRSLVPLAGDNGVRGDEQEVIGYSVVEEETGRRRARTVVLPVPTGS